MSNLNEILERLAELQNEIMRLKAEEVKALDWRETEDVLLITDFNDSSIELSSNHVTWNSTKGEEKPLYLEAYNKLGSVHLALELEDMIKLRDYLNQKIEFLSE
ncbi:hypothetical protein D7X33_27545 [Butyricicoccus sp. 1XD8-22]|nr:hypothetical protein D7X33_27545 [Butyricicoccus sp. 1XD8-22]